MESTCEMFMNYAYDEEEALEAFHPLKNIQAVFVKIISYLQRMLNRIRGLRAVYIPKLYVEKFKETKTDFKDATDEILAMLKNNDFSKIDNIKDACDKIEKGNEYTNFISLDTSIYGKDDYVKLDDGKDITTLLNIMIKIATDLKTKLIKNPETEENVKNNTNVLIRFFNIVIKYLSKVLKFHPPLRDPKNVNKLDGVGTAKIYT